MKLGCTQYKKSSRDVPPTWVAKSASWNINDPLVQNFVQYMNGSIFQRNFQIWAKIGSNLRKFVKNQVLLVKIWPKIMPN